jgi:hypothetical protein
MRKLIVGLAALTILVFAGLLTWTADATPLTGSATTHPVTSSSLVERTGCWLPGLPGECDVGMRKIYDRHGHWKCTPCPGWYPWRDSKPAH